MHSLVNELKGRKVKISVVGLGYVGLPIAVELSEIYDVIGFDINESKIDLYRRGIDPTLEVGNDVVAECGIDFTADHEKLKEARFHIIAVPTPVNDDHNPDLDPIISASRLAGRSLVPQSVVVFESTVYPGLTEEICIPILEKESGLTCGIDFKVGYSPERINPGDRERRLRMITKIVSGSDEEALDIIAEVYESIIDAGVYRAPSIKVAEAAKVIENSQRDINIAFVNELSIIFSRMGIDTQEVLKAAGTKWNFLNFSPGLVGGHCIGVDPYYLTYKAAQLGYNSQVVLAGRRINDEMGRYVTRNVIREMIKAGLAVQDAKIAILGFTFKANCPDIRNTKVLDIYNELGEYGLTAAVHDPMCDYEEAKMIYDVECVHFGSVKDSDVIIIAVDHDSYKELDFEDFDRMFRDSSSKKLLFDLKGILDRKKYEDSGYIYWRL